MKNRGISIATDPDAHTSGHSKKRALFLFIGAISACWACMELRKALSISLPLSVLIVIHAVSILALVLVYRWLQLKAQGDAL